MTHNSAANKMRIDQDRSSLTGRAAGTAGNATLTSRPRGKGTTVVPANAGTHTPCPLDGLRNVGPGSSPGRRWADRFGCDPPSHPEHLAVAGLDFLAGPLD